MEALAARLARAGLTLRTGASPGADQAFARGAARAGGAVELYLPWPSFESAFLARAQGRARIALGAPEPAARALAERLHARWNELDDAERDLRARDVHQVLGTVLDSPVEFVLAWTPDGSLDGAAESAGGTGQALRAAAARGIPVVNLARGTGAQVALAELLGSRR
jgi:hypothetical protein